MPIPASLLNMRIHAIIDFALGWICFIFQIAALANSPNDVYEQIGIGFWGGLILIATAAAAYKSTLEDAPFMLGCSFILSIFSFMVSFSIMCIFAASIDTMNKYSGNVCDGTFVAPSPCIPYATYAIPPCSYYNSAHVGFDSILLICGIVGIPVNAFLVMGVIMSYNPVATAPAA